jgi:hypothetical protein
VIRSIVNMKGVLFSDNLLLVALLFFSCSTSKQHAYKLKTSKEEVLTIINKVNDYTHGRAFWDNAAYHTGNMEVVMLTKNEVYRKYSEAWAERNQWQGAKSTNKAEWKDTYGERDDFVLFGDWQICFQTYKRSHAIPGKHGEERLLVVGRWIIYGNAGHGEAA